MEENRIPKIVLYMNLETMRLRGRPSNRWQDEVREDEKLVGGIGWKERLYNRQKLKKLLRTARNHHILQMPMEWKNSALNYAFVVYLCLHLTCISCITLPWKISPAVIWHHMVRWQVPLKHHYACICLSIVHPSRHSSL